MLMYIYVTLIEFQPHRDAFIQNHNNKPDWMLISESALCNVCA